MIANVVFDDGSMRRISMPKPIPVSDETIKNVYVGRRTASIVVEWHSGDFYFVAQRLSSYVRKFPGVQSAIDAVKEPRPL